MAVKASGTGAFLIPTAPAVGTTVAGGAANTFTTNAVQLIASTAAAIFITGLHVQLSSTSKPTYVVIRLSTGAGDGSIVGEFVVPYAYTAGATGTQMMGFVPIWPPIAVATSTRIGAKSADSVGSLNHTVILQCINQSNVVAEGVIAETVDVLKWNGTAVSAPATAGIPDVNVKNIDNDAASASGTVTFPNATLASTTNITAATGVDITKILGTAISTPATAGILDVNVKNIDNDAASASGTVTFPNATLASTTNITAGTITTATNVTTVNGLANNVITAASMAADASAEIADAVWDELKSGHTVADSFGDYLDDEITSRATVADVPSAATVADAVWDEDATGHQTQGSFGQAIGDPVADTNTIYKAVVTDATGATVGVDVVAVKAETASIQADTDNIQTRIPAALTTDGNIKADTLRVGGTLQTAGDIIGDTNDIQSRLPAALSGDGFMKADMKSIDDELTSGNNATLYLKQLNMVNSTGNAFVAQSTGNDGYGMRVSGNGFGSAAIFEGGDNSSGIEALGGTTSGNGLLISTQTSDYALEVASLHGTGAFFDGNEGNGIEISGGDGDGILVYGGGLAGNGMSIQGSGTGKSINAPHDIELSDGTFNLTAIEDTVWDATLADHQDAGSTGEALGDAGSAGDPWNTPLPGAYGAGTAGKIIGENINATISSRATQTSVDDLPTNAELATALDPLPTAAENAAATLSAADSNPIAANIKEVNDVEITGDGSVTPWGPV